MFPPLANSLSNSHAAGRTLPACERRRDELCERGEGPRTRRCICLRVRDGLASARMKSCVSAVRDPGPGGAFAFGSGMGLPVLG
jgi:hypothetical protein